MKEKIEIILISILSIKILMDIGVIKKIKKNILTLYVIRKKRELDKIKRKK